MESVVTFEPQDQIAKDLHESADRIHRVLDELHSLSVENMAKLASPQQMSDLLSGLMQAGQWLRVLPSNRDKNLEQRVCEYHTEVGRLRSFLPAIQASLLAERGRLEKERERLNGAMAWAYGSSQTIAK